MNGRELALADNVNDEAKHLHAFIEFLNFLEIYSAAINAGLLTGVAREIAQDKLLDCAAILESDSYWQEKIEKSKTSETTYQHTIRFARKYNRTIATRKRAADIGSGEAREGLQPPPKRNAERTISPG